MSPALLAHGEPAGGAPLEDLIPALIVTLVLFGALALFGVAHRAGKTRLLGAVSSFSERVSGLPGWAGVPSAITGAALLVAVYGFYWDVASHIDNGRDPGPFANPAHWLIIIGLGGIAVAGIFSILLGCEESRTSVRIREGWNAPLGGLLLLVCGGIAVFGFPLDDVWHRLFGQDVTLWSPTHMQMVGGASLSTIALWVLYLEGSRAAIDAGKAKRFAVLEPAIAGALLIGLSAFHAEFDYSVPQFRLLYHPILLMLSSGIALVAARIRLGAGGALKAVGFFLAVRGVVSLGVGVFQDHTMLHFPLYIVEALAVEAAALLVSPRRQITFGAAAGLGIGTFGLAAEWGWSHIWMTIPWPAALLPEGVVAGVLSGIAGGLLGGFIGRALVPSDGPRQRVPRALGVVTGLAVLVALFYPFPSDAALEGTAHFELTEVSGRAGRWAEARIRVQPEDLAENAEWFNVTAWQGGGSVVDPLERVGPGEFRTTTPMPVHGEWKSLVRLHKDSSLVAVPVYLPRDEAIPAPEVPAEPSFTRDLISDKEIVLREAKDDVSPALVFGASGVLVAIATFWIATLAWALHRLENGRRPGVRRRPRSRLSATPAR